MSPAAWDGLNGMSNREPTATTNLDTLYGSDTIPWARAREALDANALGPETVFVLGTVRPDGRPHAGDTFTAPYSAPSAGPPPWHLFRVTTHTVFCVSGTEPAGATRWRF